MAIGMASVERQLVAGATKDEAQHTLGVCAHQTPTSFSDLVAERTLNSGWRDGPGPQRAGRKCLIVAGISIMDKGGRNMSVVTDMSHYAAE